MYFVMFLLQSSLVQAQLDLLSLELQLYGRNPGGIKYEKRPADFVPVSYSPNGVPLYDGSRAPLDCTYSSYLSVDRSTVPMYSVQPIAAAVVNKAVRVVVGGGPECQDPSGASCYPVGESDITSDIQLSDDASHILPGSFLMVGNLLNFDEGIYDIPQRSLTASPTTSERAYTPSYILMPPGQTTTDDLPTWISRNSDLFDPEKGAVSAGLYRFSTKYDVNNYPYCSLPDIGAELAAAPNTTFGGCLRPFNYSTSPLVVSGNSAVFPPQCSNIAAVQVYSSRANELQQQTMNLNSGSPLALALAGQSQVALSFWYYNAAIVGDSGAVSVLQVVSNSAASQMQFIVNALGQPAVLMPGFDSTTQRLAFGVDLRQTLWRQVLWLVSHASGAFRFQLWVDGAPMGEARFTSPAFFASSPRLTSLSSQLPASATAQVKFVESHPALNTAQAESLHACGVSRLEGRCSTAAHRPPQPERYFVALDSTSQSTDCSALSDAARLLRVSSAYDVLQPRSLQPASDMTSSWSLTFWLKGGETDATSTNLLRVSSNSNVATVTFSSATRLVTLLANQASFTAALLDGRAHHVVLQFDASTSVVRAYIDLALAFSASSPAASAQIAQLSASPQVTMVKLYNNRVLSLAEISQDAVCQMQTGVDSSLFSPPVGVCSVVAGSPYGYCRHSLLCAGHCSAYSVVDEATNQFVALSKECDDGWAAPDCLTRCARTDAITGKCLDFLTSTAVGSTPASQLCDVLANYQLSVNAGAGTLRLTPRRWQLRLTAGVPSGIVTNVIGSGRCPQVDIVGDINGDLSVNLANLATSNAQVNVLFAPPGVFNGSQACEQPCCSLDRSSPITIIANSQTSFRVPSAGCGPLAIIIERPVNIANSLPGAAPERCSAFAADEVQNLVASSFNQVVPVNVQSSIVVARNQATSAIRDLTKSLAAQVLNLFALRESSQYNQEQFRELVATSLYNLENSAIDPLVLLSYNSTFSAPSNTDALLAAQLRLRDALEAQGRTFNDTNRQIDSNRAQQEALQTEYLAALAASKASLDEAVRLLNSVGDGSDLSVLGDVFRSIAQGVVDAQRTLAGGIRDLFSLPKSLLGSLFSGLMEFVINAVIVGAICIGVYLLVKVVLSSRGSSSFAAMPPQFMYSSLPMSQPQQLPPQYRAVGETSTGNMMQRRQAQKQHKYMQHQRHKGNDSDEMEP